MRAFIPVMTANPVQPSRLKPGSSTQRRPALAAHVLQHIRTAVRMDHLGLALRLIKDNPFVSLPENLSDELDGRLRIRGICRDSDHAVDDVVNALRGEPVHTLVGDPIPQGAADIESLVKAGRVDEAVLLVEHFQGRIAEHILEKLVWKCGAMAQLRRCLYLIQHFYPKLGILVTPNMLEGLVVGCGKVGNVERAVRILEWDIVQSMGREKARVWERVVEVCIACGQLERAEALVGRMVREGIERRECVYESLLEGVSRKRGFDKCLNVLRRMKDDGVSIRGIGLYNALILGCGKGGRVNEAFEFYKEAVQKGLAPTMDTYNRLLQCCGRAGEVSRAFGVLREMREMGVPPNPKSYNWVVVACAKVADVDRAFHVIRTMKKEGTRINVVTKNNLVEACCNAGRLERAFGIVKNMVQAERVSPNVHTYNKLIRGCGKWGQMDSALRLLSSMQSAGVSPTVVTYSVAVDACARTGGQIALDRALELVDEMRDSGLEPNVVTYNSLIHACARAKNVEKAFWTLQMMRSDKVAPDNVTLCTLVDACGRAGMISKAFETMRSLPREFPSLHHRGLPTYNALIHGCLKANDIAGMTYALEDMKKRHFRPNLVTYSTIISAHAKAGDIESALDTLAEMEAFGFRPNRLVFTSIITAYGYRGNVASAMQMFDHARDLCGEPDEELYTSAIVAAIVGGRVEMAVRLSKEMKRAGYFAPKVLNKWMRKVGDTERSGEELHSVLKAMLALEIKPKRAAMESLLQAYSKEGNVAASFALLTEMSRLGYPPSTRSYRKIVQCCAVSGSDEDIEKACAMFDTVRKSITESADHQLRSHEKVELYEEMVRTVRGEMKYKYVEIMAADCGVDLAKRAAIRHCAQNAVSSLEKV